MRTDRLRQVKPWTACLTTLLCCFDISTCLHTPPPTQIWSALESLPAPDKLPGAGHLQARALAPHTSALQALEVTPPQLAPAAVSKLVLQVYMGLKLRVLDGLCVVVGVLNCARLMRWGIRHCSKSARWQHGICFIDTLC